MKQFTYNQSTMVNIEYKKNLAIINSYVVNEKDINTLGNWIAKKADYCINITTQITQAIEFTALAYALKCYKEIAEPDYHKFFDTWINNISRYVNTMLKGDYKEKFNEWMN